MAKPCPTCNAILDFGEEELRRCYMTGHQVCTRCSIFVEHLGYCLNIRKDYSQETVKQKASKYHLEQLEGMLRQNEEMADVLKKEINKQADKMYKDHLDLAEYYKDNTDIGKTG